MIVDPAQWSDRIPVCSRHGNPVTLTAKARFRSRTPVWLKVALAVIVAAAGLPVAFPSLRYLDDPDPELYLLMLGAGLFVWWLVQNILVKIVIVPDCGFCPACRNRRNRLALAILGCAVVVTLSFCLYLPIVLPEQIGDDEVSTLAQAVRWAVIFAPWTFGLAGAALCVPVRWAAIARGVASRDGSAVEFRRPAPGFARELLPAGGTAAAR